MTDGAEVLRLCKVIVRQSRSVGGILQLPVLALQEQVPPRSAVGGPHLLLTPFCK